MTYVVSTDIVNPAGICLGEEFAGEDYIPYVTARTWETSNLLNFRTYLGTYFEDSNREDYTHSISITTTDLVGDYIRRVYNLSDDIEVNPNIVYYAWSRVDLQGSQQTFETETEALEYVDTLGSPPVIYAIPNYPGRNTLFQPSWRQEIDGVLINRTVDLEYTGDPVNLYTINDVVNFLALFLEITPEEVWGEVTYLLRSTAPQDTPKPAYDCGTYLKATVVDVDGPIGPIEIDIDFTGDSIPSDVTVTVVDGDPDLILTEIANGDGAVTVHDNGNIIMSNDGGTFFLNEFGNVGFYANNDASLTANTQVQLGVGGTSITVENDCFTFRDGTGNVELTADELTRLKALLD